MRFGPENNSDDEYGREIRIHVDQLTEANVARGMSPEEARRQAVLAFGGHEQVRQELRDLHAIALLESARRNARSAMRFIRRYPGFAAVVVLTMALAIGANTAVFSMLNAVLLRPLAFPHSDELLALQQYKKNAEDPQGFVAPARLEDWNRLNSTFQGITGYFTQSASETSGELPERLDQAWVTPRFLQVWGVAPALGRNFVAEEEHAGGPSSVLISDRLWRRRFAGAADVIGKQLHFGASAMTIIGVMPASFEFPDHDVDLWAVSPPDSPYSQNRKYGWYRTVGRLKPGISIEQARADLATVQQKLGKQFPETDSNIGARMETLKSVVVADSGASLWLLFASVTLLLLLACSNIAALLLARTTEREHEISIRFSLGATRRSVIAQLLSEMFALAAIGSALGLALAYWAIHAIRSGVALPRGNEISLDARIFVYTLTCSIVCTLGCGLLPALRGTRGELARSLATTSHTQVTGRTSLQRALVSTQVALAVTLLVGAGLLLQSRKELGRVAAGFDTQHVLTLRITGSYAETMDIPRLTARMERTLDSLRAIPGAQDAATAVFMPGGAGVQPSEFNLVERSDPTQKLSGEIRFVSEGYFSTMQIPVLLGSGCQRGATTQQAVVNRSFANLYLPVGDPLQRHLHWVAGGVAETSGIVGVVADAREDGLATAPSPTIYACVAAGEPSPIFLVRTTSQNPMALADTVRRVLKGIEPARSVYELAPLTEKIDKSEAEQRMRTMLLTIFAIAAITLASLGIYGSLAYFARLRRREIALRLALGESRAQIAYSLLVLGIRIAAIGCVAGLASAIFASRLLRGMLFAISPLDPSTYGEVIALVAMLTIVASLLPAVQGAKTDPIRALREE